MSGSSRPLLGLVGLLGLLGLLAAAGCSGEQAPRESPPAPLPEGQVLGATRCVLLLVLDGVSASETSPYASARDVTPQLRRLAEEGVVYEDHIACSLGTNAALASLVTGAYSQETGVGSMHDLGQQKLAGSQTTLAERFRAAGWRTFASLALPQLSAPMSGLEQGVERYDAPAVEETNYRNAQQVLYRLHGLMQEALESGEPVFGLCHFADARRAEVAPGAPGASFLEAHLGRFRESMPLVAAALDRAPKDPEGAHEDLRKLLGRGRGSDSYQAWRAAIHDGQLAFVDEQLGDLRTLLERSGRWHDSLIVVTGGAGPTRAREEFEAGPLFSEEMLHLPLVVRFPGGGMRGRVAGLTQPIDARATLEAFLGWERQATQPALDWLALARDPALARGRIGLCETAALDRRAVVDADFTLEPDPQLGTRFSHRPDGRLVGEAELVGDTLARRERLEQVLSARTPEESWRLRSFAEGADRLEVVWRYLRGFGLRHDASGGVTTRRRGLPATVSGEASLSEPEPLLELLGNRRDLPLRLELRSVAGRELEPDMVHVGERTLAEVLIPRLASRRGAQESREQAALEGDAQPPWSAGIFEPDHFWWRLALNGPAMPAGASVELVAAMYPPGNIDEELEWKAEAGIEVEPLAGRLDAVRVRGRAPFELRMRRLPRREIAFAVAVDGRVLDNSELRAQDAPFSAPGELILYLPDWMAGVTDELDRPLGAEADALPSGSLRLSRSGSGLAAADREALPSESLLFVRRLGGTE